MVLVQLCFTLLYGYAQKKDKELQSLSRLIFYMFTRGINRALVAPPSFGRRKIIGYVHMVPDLNCVKPSL